MNNFLLLALVWVAGLLLGGFYFGGLWWTVRQGVSSKHPARWFLGSMLARMSIVLLGFYFVGRGDWHRVAACLVGFIIARFIVSLRLRSGQVRLTRTPIEHSELTTKEASHAP